MPLLISPSIPSSPLDSVLNQPFPFHSFANPQAPLMLRFIVSLGQGSPSFRILLDP